MFYEDPYEATVPEDHTPLTADDLTFDGEEVLNRQQEYLNNTSGDFDLGAVRGLIFHLLPSLNILQSVLLQCREQGRPPRRSLARCPRHSGRPY